VQNQSGPIKQNNVFEPVLPAFVQQGTGATYYVDSTTGRDTADGKTLATAKQTLAAALNCVMPGDTVLVAPGEHRGGKTAHVRGTADNWILIAALDPANKPVFRSMEPEVRNSQGILIGGGSPSTASAYLKLENLTVDGAMGYGISTQYGQNIAIVGCEVYNCGFGSNRAGFFTGSAYNFLLENCISDGNREHGYYMSNAGRNYIVRGCISRNNHCNGIQINADLNYAWMDEILVDGDGQDTGVKSVQDAQGIANTVLFEGNILHNNNLSAPNSGTFNFAGVHNGTLRNNLIYDTHARAISMWQGNARDTCRNMAIYNNTLIHTQADSANPDVMTIPIDAGVFWGDDGERGRAQFSGDSEGVVVPGNPWTGTPINVRVYNNILVGACGISIAPSQNERTNDNGGTMTTLTADSGVVIENNVFGMEQSVALLTTEDAGDIIDAAVRAGFDAGNNLFVADWQQTLIVSHANCDYRLTPASPAIGAGCPVAPALTHDLRGTPRTGDADVGCYAKGAPCN